MIGFSNGWPRRLNCPIETPWHLTDGHGNSTEPTGDHVWSTRRHRWKDYSEFHQWPPVVNRWKTSSHRWKMTIFEMITWHVVHSNAEKNGKRFPKKAITKSKGPNSINIENMDAALVSNDAAGQNEENTSGIKAF